MRRILSLLVAMGTGLFEPPSININCEGDVETYLKIKYYAHVFKRKVVEMEIKKPSWCNGSEVVTHNHGICELGGRKQRPD